MGNILAFAQLAIGMDPDEDVTIASMPWSGVWYNGASLVVAQRDELLEILNDGINPYRSDIRSSDLQLMYKKSDGSFGVTNATLLDMAAKAPSTMQALLEVSGVGEVKAARYGKAFLKAISDWQEGRSEA